LFKVSVAAEVCSFISYIFIAKFFFAAIFWTAAAPKPFTYRLTRTFVAYRED